MHPTHCKLVLENPSEKPFVKCIQPFPADHNHRAQKFQQHVLCRVTFKYAIIFTTTTKNVTHSKEQQPKRAKTSECRFITNPISCILRSTCLIAHKIESRICCFTERFEWECRRLKILTRVDIIFIYITENHERKHARLGGILATIEKHLEMITLIIIKYCNLRLVVFNVVTLQDTGSKQTANRQ